MLKQEQIPCVLYLHSHGGCRLDGMFLNNYLLPKTSICLFDFAGSGLSEGEYITLGAKESRDTLDVIEYIKVNYKVS